MSRNEPQGLQGVVERASAPEIILEHMEGVESVQNTGGGCGEAIWSIESK